MADDEHSLKAGVRGPTLMEDFHFREKLPILTTNVFLSVSYMLVDLVHMVYSNRMEQQSLIQKRTF